MAERSTRLAARRHQAFRVGEALHIEPVGRSCLDRLSPQGVRMEWTIVGMNLLYAVVGVVLMWVTYRVIDRLTPEVNFAEELRKGNVATAIFLAAIFLSIAIIIAGALN
jgi:hypothetical protein